MKNIQYFYSVVAITLIIPVFFILYNNFSSTHSKPIQNNIQSQTQTQIPAGNKTAYFAGWCFWCMEGPFESTPWVFDAFAGYAGGAQADATYEKVWSGKTGHREWVQVIYNPKIITYKELVKIYFQQIDPTDPDGQFADKGFQYTTAIYYQDQDEKKIIDDYIKSINDSKKFKVNVQTKVVPFTTFFKAEEYHQDYYKTSALRYNQYKKGSGRADFIHKSPLATPETATGSTGTWAKNSLAPQTMRKPIDKAKRLSELTDLQYKVTQKWGTETPFKNEYWDNHEEGIYVDIVDGAALYSSQDKYDSGTGWPSFTKPISMANIKEVSDDTFWSRRTEVRGATSDSHIGHVFNDGPVDKWGMRFCMNSAAMKFIPLADLEKEGYGEYKKLFQ